MHFSNHILLRNIILFIVLFLIDLYAYQAFKTLAKKYSDKTKKRIRIGYLLISTFCFTVLFIAGFYNWHDWNKYFRTYAFAILLIIMWTKLMIDIFLLVDDLIRLFRWIIKKITNKVHEATPEKPAKTENAISRSDFLVKTGLLIASIPFFSLVYGMVANATNFKIRKVKLPLPNLPDSFEGFRIVHISDIHTGSFTSTEPLERAVNLINEQKADAVFFTGDLVNDICDETLPYLNILNKIKATHGVFSIFGNHDYGDYYNWQNEDDKKKNLENLKHVHQQLGWDLLLDEYRHIEKNGERISVIGIQNCGAMGFSNYGSIKKATENLDYSPVNILLSHDPSYWKKEITKNYPQIDITLSGHTHGMQFGVEIPGFKWSPVQYIYKEWADLYSVKKQYLYVNRGLGFIGYPGRVGILPEITVMELSKT